MFDKARKKRARSKEAEELLWTSETFAGLIRPLKEKWPGVREQIAPVVSAAGEKLGDLYASAAQFVTEKKEAFEDRLAQRKAETPEATAKPESKPASAEKTPEKGAPPAEAARD